jgi:hypothetical protein
MIRTSQFVRWLLAVPAAAFVAMCFVAIDRHSHSASDTLTNLYPYAGVTFLLWDWMARRLDERAIR